MSKHQIRSTRAIPIHVGGEEMGDEIVDSHGRLRWTKRKRFQYIAELRVLLNLGTISP